MVFASGEIYSYKASKEAISKDYKGGQLGGGKNGSQAPFSNIGPNDYGVGGTKIASSRLKCKEN